MEADDIRQIESDVVVDFDHYFQLHPNDPRPLFGLEEPEEGDICETQQSELSKCFCGKRNCPFDKEQDLYLYDDRNVDSFAMNQYISSEGALFVRYKSCQDELREEHHELFPRKIHGFVLRERKWRKSCLVFPAKLFPAQMVTSTPCIEQHADLFKMHWISNA